MWLCLFEKGYFILLFFHYLFIGLKQQQQQQQILQKSKIELEWDEKQSPNTMIYRLAIFLFIHFVVVAAFILHNP